VGSAANPEANSELERLFPKTGIALDLDAKAGVQVPAQPAHQLALIVHSLAGRFRMLFATAAPEHERPPIEDSIDAPQICVIKAHERRLGFCPAKRHPWRRRQIVRALFL
jgi:hypothetical protein